MTALRCWPAALCGSLLMAGCTCVSVVKVKPGDEAAGVRYSLPRPFVVVTPQADGTLEVKVEMLPDPANTYAVDSFSFLSAHEVSLKLTQEGLLTEANLVQDAAAVAAEASKAGGELARGYQELRIAEAKAALEERKLEEAKRRAAAEDLQKKIADAEVALAVARAEWRVLDDRRKAGIAVDDRDLRAAEQKVRAAEERLSVLKYQLQALSGSSPFAAALSAPGQVEQKDAFGPIFFRVVELPTGGVSLEAAEEQFRFPTYQASR